MRLITVGFACNNACVFCAQGDLRATPAAIDVPAAVTAIVAGETVAFLGGEPTLHDELPAWIRAAAERGAARVIVQTNGRRLAYRAFTRALREASARLVLDVSLHGSTAAMHDYHTGSPGSFAQTVHGLRNARAEGIAAGVTTVVTRSNFRHLTDVVRVAHVAGATAIHLAEARAFGSAARDRARVIPASEMIAPHIARAVAEAERRGMAIQVGERALSPRAEGFFAGIGEVERKDVILARPSSHHDAEDEEHA